jgi:hypothetical protein
MFGLKPATIINLAVIVALGAGAAWRGYQRRRPYWSPRSWAAFSLTVALGLALSGFALVFSAAVDSHAGWIGAAGSNQRGGWIVAAAASLVAGPLLAALSLSWFAQGDPECPFPTPYSVRRKHSAPSADPGLPSSATLGASLPTSSIESESQAEIERRSA